MSASGRIHAFDWLRGVAVVVMIQTHSLVLLKPELSRDALFSWLVRIDGLVAPSFIFSAGFALALVQVRSARSSKDVKAQRRAQALKTLKRIGEVLLVASVVNTVWFPTWREPKWLLRIDILHCIGLSLLLVLPLLVGLASRPQLLRWVMLGLAGLVFALSPLAEHVDGVWAIFATRKVGLIDATHGTTFPLFPWSGYVFLGASFGATVGMLQPSSAGTSVGATLRAEAPLWRWWALLWGVGAALWATDGFWREAYPPHDFWANNPANAAQRWALVLSLVALFRLIEVTRPASTTSRLARLVGTFGASSLSAYVFHEMLLYQRHVGVFTKLFRERCDWGTYWPVLAALVAATWGCVQAWDRIDPRLRAWLAKKRTPAPA
ncbi:MAG: DUF1624 domain-containing protein [Myxococcaceae bacterium]|nr:DUF1624 domain-containing protein [Myxococcaceae bacterium]